MYVYLLVQLYISQTQIILVVGVSISSTLQNMYLYICIILHYIHLFSLGICICFFNIWKYTHYDIVLIYARTREKIHFGSLPYQFPRSNFSHTMAGLVFTIKGCQISEIFETLVLATRPSRDQHHDAPCSFHIHLYVHDALMCCLALI